MSKTPVLQLALETPETADGPAAAILAAARDQLGFVPNMYAVMANLPAVLEHYTSAYAAFRGTAGFSPTEQETVLLAISQANGCHYCVAAHSMLADKVAGMPADALAALRDGADPADPKLGALARFARQMTVRRGSVERADVEAFLAAGYAEQHVLGIVLAIECKVFSNYTNHLARTDIDAAFAPYAAEDDGAPGVGNPARSR
jgi:uncharacterized peroxidase-related enzyme